MKRKLLLNKPLDWVVPVRCATLEQFLELNNWAEVLGVLFVDIDKLDLKIDTSNPRVKWLVYCQCLTELRDKIDKFLTITFGDVPIEISASGMTINGELITPLFWQQFLDMVVEMYRLDWEVLRPTKPTNSKVAEMKARLQQTRDAVRRVKEKEGKVQTVEGMIIGLCGRDPSLNFLNVFELNYYQFIHTIQSVNSVDDFEFSMNALLQGADPKKVKPKHWTEQ